MKIVFIVSTLENTAPNKVLYSELKYLGKHIKPVVVTLSPEVNNSIKNDVENELGIPVYSVNLNRLLGYFIGPLLLSRLLAKINPDIVQSHGLRADIFTYLAAKKYKTVSILHNHPYQDLVYRYKSFLGNVFTFLQISVLKKFDKPVSISKAVCKDLARIANFHPTCIQDGVDTEIFHKVKSPEIKRNLRTQLSLPIRGKIYISTTNIIPLKNPLSVIQAFKKFNKRQDHLVFLGTGSILDECKQLAANDPYIHFIGRVENVVDYLQASDYFISASFTEAVSLAVLEALACGLPVLLSNIPQQKELFEYTREPVVFFDPYDYHSIAAAMEEQRIRDYEKTSGMAVKLIDKHFSETVMIRNYEKLFAEIMTGMTTCKELV